ncbi:MAG: hypothetical protein QXW94_06880, partial [Desulfurococcaceae archaeon]
MKLDYSSFRDYWLGLAADAARRAMRCAGNIRAAAAAFNTNVDAVKILKPGDFEALAARAGAMCTPTVALT